MQRIANPSTPVRFRPQPPLLLFTSINIYTLFKNLKIQKKIVVSGGFDPVHIGHLEMLKQAREIGSHLTVILNSDKFLLDKKGFVFYEFHREKKKFY